MSLSRFFLDFALQLMGRRKYPLKEEWTLNRGQPGYHDSGMHTGHSGGPNAEIALFFGVVNKSCGYLL